MPPLGKTTLGDGLDLVLVCSARTVLARPLTPPAWITGPVASPNGSQARGESEDLASTGSGPSSGPVPTLALTLTPTPDPDPDSYL